MLDEAVRKAMERWPNVPDVYGWLRLDRRGQWLIKDETIANVTVRDFISRNYLRTDGGAYAFQNGPQRVFVELDYAPWVVSLQPSGELRLHTGVTCGVPKAAWMDEAGAFCLKLTILQRCWTTATSMPLVTGWLRSTARNLTKCVRRPRSMR